MWFLSSDALRNEKTFNIHSCFCCAPITRWISRILTHPCAPIPSSIFLFHGENEMVPPSCQDCKKRWAFTSQTRTLLGVPLFEKWSIQTAFARGGAFYKGAPSHPGKRLTPPPPPQLSTPIRHCPFEQITFQKGASPSQARRVHDNIFLSLVFTANGIYIGVFNRLVTKEGLKSLVGLNIICHKTVVTLLCRRTRKYGNSCCKNPT